MENDKSKDPKSQGDAARSALEGQPQGRGSSPAETSVRGDDLLARLDAQAAQIERLSAELQAHQAAFRDTEVSLVSRIADVDDDRRHADTRLQRTLQAQREELDERFGRQRAFVWTMLLLTLLLIAGATAFAYFQLAGVRDALSDEIEEVRGAVDRAQTAVQPAEASDTRERLSELSQAVNELSASLDKLEEPAAAQPAMWPAEPAPESAPEPEPAQQDAAPATETEPSPLPDDRSDSPAGVTEETPPPPPASTEPTEEDAAEESPAVEPEQTRSPASGEDATPAAPAQPAAVEETTTPPTTGGEPEPAPGPLERSTPEASDEPVTSGEGEHRNGQQAVVKVGDTPYTVQLMGFFSLDALDKFTHEHELPQQLYYQTTTYQDRPWYVLIHSVHPTQASADAVVAALPPALAKLDIWVRRMKADDEITAFQQTGD